MSDELRFRRAVDGDLPALVAPLSDDVLGEAREADSFANYEAAFADIDGDSRHLLVVGEQAGCVVACLQATVLPCLTHGGRRRAQFEGIRVASDLLGQSVGRKMMSWAIAWAEARGCGVVQLTTDRQRAGARRFYETPRRHEAHPCPGATRRLSGPGEAVSRARSRHCTRHE